MAVKVTDEQIDHARKVNLPEFLMANGFNLKRVGNEYVWTEHDSLHIKNNATGEKGKWFRFSTNKGGDNIDFLREFMNYSFVEAVEALSGEKAIEHSFSNNQRVTNITDNPNNQKELIIKENRDCKRAIAYLTQTRKLDYNFVIKLVKSGAISQEEKTGNVLFKFFDKDKIIGAEKVGTSTEHRYKGIATGSASNRGFELKRGNGEKAYFFESAIDMLSFIEIHNKELDNCRLISMMGVKPNTVIETMKRYNIKPENVYLCSDNDKAGNEFAERLQAEYPEIKRLVTPDIYKDWNDMLRDIRKTEPVKEEKKSLVAVTEEITQKNKHFTELVNSGKFSQANEISQQLSELNDKADLLKKDIQEENITINDIEVLRSIEPKRKSIQNMLETEVAKTPKFEKLLNEEMGEKSAYEMRKGNNAWREDENKTVPVIDVQKLDTSHVREDKKNGVLKRGNFINKDTGIIINFGNAGIEDTLSHAAFKAKRHISTDVNISSLYHMQELIENAICFDTNISEAIKNKSSNSLFMHKMYGVIKYENELYLAVLSIEESYATEKEKNNELSSTNNRMYNLKGIKITPTKLKTGFSVPSILSNDSRAELRGVTISIPQLYNFVKTFDKNFYENRNALGRAEREKEIAEHNEYLNAVKKLEEHNNEKSLNEEKGMLNMPVKNETNKNDEKNMNNQEQKITEDEILKMAEQIIAKRNAEKQQSESENFQENTNEFQKNVPHEKLLPLLKSKAEYHSKRVDNLSGKIANQNDKIERHSKKLKYFHAKIERLEDMNKMLKIFGNIPFANKLIKSNEKKMETIKNKKIPARNGKIKVCNQKLEKYTLKRNRLNHKLNRVLALNDTIRSFSIGMNKERRETFRDAMGRLNDSQIDCMNDKLTALINKKNKLFEIYNSEDISTVDKYNMQSEIKAATEKISTIGDKIDKLTSRRSEFEKQSDKDVDNSIIQTEKQIDEMTEQGNISISEMCEKICESSVQDKQKGIDERNETENNYLKTAEMSVEDNYNNIDGIINNTTVERVLPKEVAENTCAELDSKNIQYTKTENDKEAVNVQVPEENEQDLKQAEKNAVEKQAAVYINKEFFKSLNKGERYTQRMDEKSARETIKDLESKGIEHSAVLNGDKSGVIVRKDDYKKSKASFSMKQLKKIGEKINHNYKSQEAPKKEKSTIEH